MVADERFFLSVRTARCPSTPRVGGERRELEHVLERPGILLLTVTVVIAALALAFALGILAARRRSDRQYETALRRLDKHMAPISANLREAVERARVARVVSSGDGPPTPNLEKLLERIAAEGRPAHAFRELAEAVVPELARETPAPSPKHPAERDHLTGVRSRSGYDVELEREVARAQRTGRPLSLVLLDLGHPSDTEVRPVHPDEDRLLQEFAALLVRVTRVTDTVCRRGGEEFGILLPETTATGARHFHRRVHEEARRTTFGQGGQVTFSSGIVEWRANDTRESFDARACTAVGRSLVRSIEPPEDADDRDDARDTPRAR